MTGVLTVNVGVAVNSYLVAELTAEKLIKGNAVGLSCKVPKGDLNTRNTAALTGRAAELLKL